MNKEYITIKEYAKIKGCSLQYAYKLASTKLKPFVELVEGRKVFISAVLDTDFSTNSTKNSTDSFNNSTEVENQIKPSSSAENDEEIKRINRRNEEIIDKLQAQLLEKDEQIKNQSEHIVELSSKIAELFENNQKLQLNYQYLLNDSKEQLYEEINEQGARAHEEVIEEPKKKSLFSKFFNR